VINLTSDQPGAFNSDTARRLMAFAAPAALAVENARLYAAELQARQLAETLNEVSRALSQTLNFDKVMNTLLEYICRLVPVDRAYIVICENESTLTIQALRGYEDENNPKYQLKDSLDVLDLPYLHEVIDTQKSILIADTREYPSWTTLISQQPLHNWLGVPIIVNDKAMGVLALAKAEPNCIHRDHIWLAEVVIAQAAVAIQNAWLFEQIRSGHERLQSLSRRLVEVQESERRYIARELHDEAGQSLTALKFGLRLLEQDVDKPDSLLLRISELKQLTDSVSEELHRLAMDLRPASLDYLGLVVALEQLVKGFADRYPMIIRFKESGFDGYVRLPDYIETNIYRIVQEALTNAVRHAQASNVDVIVENRAGKVVVIIEDDGVGFEIAEISRSGHLGLLGIQERIQMIAGSLQIESIPGGGTTIVVEVPYVNSDFDRR
jgi:signal transduction histidine kinase